VKAWVKALVVASIVEAPLLIILATRPPANWNKSVLVSILGWYHLPAGYLAYVVLAFLDPGPGLKAHLLQWSGMFAFQVLMTTPVIFVVFRWTEHARRKKLIVD
jgi:hypothetical protein